MRNNPFFGVNLRYNYSYLLIFSKFHKIKMNRDRERPWQREIKRAEWGPTGLEEGKRERETMAEREVVGAERLGRGERG